MSELLEKLKDLLDETPMGTLTALAGIACVLYAYITGSINIDEAFKYFGLVSGGSAAIGIMRTHAGKGVK